MKSWRILWLQSTLILLLPGCFDDDVARNSAPVATPSSEALQEDGSLQVQLLASDPDGDNLSYLIIDGPYFGRIELLPGSSQAVYTPNQNFFGFDSFHFVAVDTNGARSKSARITLQVKPAPDPPTLEVPAKGSNSAYEQDSILQFVAIDPDGDLVRVVRIESSSPNIATVSVDEEKGILRIRPLQSGSTKISLSISDGTHVVSDGFDFEVGDVDKISVVQVSEPATGAIRISNNSSESVQFRLMHNGFTSFQSVGDVARFIRDLPDAYEGQPFERKLWRFLIENVIHDYPLSEDAWLMDPLITVNSLGWGFCSNVASAFARIAESAGMQARIWGLGGHVVPEVLAPDGTWQMYDPDLAVYYRTESGALANVEQLQAQPHLVSMPIDPLFPIGNGTPYSEYVGGIYGSDNDNAVDMRFMGPDSVIDGSIILPPQTQLIYPGRWSDDPVGFDGGIAHKVSNFRQARLEIPAGWYGVVHLPWMLAEILGQGQVNFLGTEYSVGDDALRRRLKAPKQFATGLEIKAADTNISLIFYVNVVRYSVEHENTIVMTGRNVWALETASIELPIEEAAGGRLPTSILKPIPPVRR